MRNEKKKFIYVGIPKTATSSMVNYFRDVLKLKMVGGKHDLIRRHKNLDNYYKFSFVRNPWDWCVSRFYQRMHCRKIQNKWFHKEFKAFMIHTKELRNKYSFENRADRQKIRKKHNEIREIIPQLFWLTNKNGSVVMDFIGRFENIQKDFNIACDKIGIPRHDLPFKNVSKKKKHYTEYYDEETKKIVDELYKKDIETFKYKFGDN